jgi:hypothetical protein
MGGSKGSTVINSEPAITPAVAKDAQIAQSMRGAQQQERSLRRGIASTYSRFGGGQMQGASENGNGLKKSLG